MYFFVHMSNFILQNFKELDRVVRKSIILSKTQKMSKREQRKKIALVSQQISDLKDRVAKLESPLRTLEQDPDQYFQNLNPNNQEYVKWKKNNSSTEEKKKDCGATAASSGRSVHFGFFSALIGHFHTAASTTPTWESSRSSSSYGHTAPGYYSSYTHASGGSVSFPSVGHYFLHFPKLHSLCLHLLLPLHPLLPLLLLSLHLDLHPPITLAAFVQIVLINIYVDNLFPLNVI